MTAQRVELTAINPRTPIDASRASMLWTAAAGIRYAVADRLLSDWTQPADGTTLAGWIAARGGRPLGVILADLDKAAGLADRYLGAIEALGVLPHERGRGVGTELLRKAESWLVANGAGVISVGGGPRCLYPGVPDGIRGLSFLAQRGYVQSGTALDLVADLGSIRRWPTTPKHPAMTLESATEADDVELSTFLRSEFPGRWSLGFDNFRRQGGRRSDVLLLRDSGRIVSFCGLSFEDSVLPPMRYLSSRRPRPWGELGPIGVAADDRAKGYGSIMLEAGLSRLRDASVRACWIRWTNKPGFYIRFGFRTERRYSTMTKIVARVHE
jgi:GNAT superfamily N-acetyltransferase